MSMIKPFISIIPLLLTLNSYAQIYVNPGVDTTSMEVRSAFHFYNNYISDFKGRKQPDMKKYWPANELKQRKIPDQLIYGISSSPLYFMGYRPTILYMRPTKNYVHIKTQFSSTDSSKNILTLAITNHYVAFDNNKQPYFINPLTMSILSWRSKVVRNITFYYPAYHKFNKNSADSLLKQVIKLENEWGLQPINIRYYMADDPDELYKFRGFDFAVGMGNKLKPSGISDDKDNQVFCGSLGENYFHEVVHIYLNHLYPKSPIQEGLAVLYGGSMGHLIKWHLKRVNNYLLEHPRADLTDVDNFWYTDTFTNPSSAIQGMICSLVYQKDGITGLKRLMAYTSYKQIFQKEFNISTDQLNLFLRKTISEQAGN